MRRIARTPGPWHLSENHRTGGSSGMNPITFTTSGLRLGVAILALAGLTACGGGGAVGGGRNDAPIRSFATGPVYDACLRGGRDAANRSLCGCVQASADASLGRSEQARAVAFFRDPNLAQVTRQSDRAGDERFWQRYKRFVAVAETTCA